MRSIITHLLVTVFTLFLFGNTSATSQVIKGTYAIKNVETGKLLRPINASKADGASIVMYSPTNWKCLTWDFHHVINNTYLLQNLFSDKTFMPGSNSITTGTELKQFGIDTNSKIQQWEFIEVTEGQYRIKLAGTDLYITPADPSGATNSVVVLRNKLDGNLQLWTIYIQNPTM